MLGWATAIFLTAASEPNYVIASPHVGPSLQKIATTQLPDIIGVPPTSDDFGNTMSSKGLPLEGVMSLLRDPSVRKGIFSYFLLCLTSWAKKMAMLDDVPFTPEPLASHSPCIVD